MLTSAQVLGQLSINSMALPPVLQFGSQALKDKVCRDVIHHSSLTHHSHHTRPQSLTLTHFSSPNDDKVCRDVITGRKHISLAISEPGAGSDVANIQTLAEKKVDRVFRLGLGLLCAVPCACAVCVCYMCVLGACAVSVCRVCVSVCCVRMLCVRALCPRSMSGLDLDFDLPRFPRDVRPTAGAKPPTTVI